MSPTSQYALQRSLSSPPVSMYQPNVVSGPDRVAKLRSELGTVQQNCRVFGEILTELSSGAGNPDDIELLEVVSVYVVYSIVFHLSSHWAAASSSVNCSR